MSIKESIGWADASCNAIHGCTMGCDYCYARRMAYRLRGRCGYPRHDPFIPTFTPSQLKKLDRKKPTRFFISSMGDMFDPLVKKEWVGKVFDAMERNPQHTYFILTKRPERIQHYPVYNFGGNIWLGVSVTCAADIWRIKTLIDFWRGHKFVSFEPLMEIGRASCRERVSSPV